MTGVGSTTIQYDSIGNPTMWGENSGGIWYDGAILEWQSRQLQSFQAFRELDGDYMDADYAVYFKYNSEGIRTEKITDTGNHEYILNGDQIVGEWIANRSKLIVYLYDEMGLPIGMKIRDYTQAEGEFDEYFFEKNLQGDIVAVYNMDGERIGSYTYDAWGNFTITLASTNTSAENDIVNTYNPYRYRGYYYDVETGLYYLQSRYYNPARGRFISSDGYVSTGQGLLGHNMFAYCGNNPVNSIDSSGMFWETIGGFFSSVWDGIKNFATSFFGAEYTATNTLSEYERSFIPDPWPITIKGGTNTTETVDQQGDSSKPFSVYANYSIDNSSISSSAGFKINISDFSLTLNLALDNIGIYASITDGNTTDSFGIKLNLSELKLGFEGSRTVQWDNKAETVYSNISANAWAIVAAVYFVQTGQYIGSPQHA